MRCILRDWEFGRCPTTLSKLCFELVAGRVQIPPQFLPTANQRLPCGTPCRFS